jgi:hypothetical protein
MNLLINMQHTIEIKLMNMSMFQNGTYSLERNSDKEELKHIHT